MIEAIPLERADRRVETRRETLRGVGHAEAVHVARSVRGTSSRQKKLSNARSSSVPSMSTSTVSMRVPVDADVAARVMLAMIQDGP